MIKVGAIQHSEAVVSLNDQALIAQFFGGISGGKIWILLRVDHRKRKIPAFILISSEEGEKILIRRSFPSCGKKKDLYGRVKGIQSGNGCVGNTEHVVSRNVDISVLFGKEWEKKITKQKAEQQGGKDASGTQSSFFVGKIKTLLFFQKHFAKDEKCGKSNEIKDAAEIDLSVGEGIIDPRRIEKRRNGFGNPVKGNVEINRVQKIEEQIGKKRRCKRDPRAADRRKQESVQGKKQKSIEKITEQCRFGGSDLLASEEEKQYGEKGKDSGGDQQ
jgi:hypothetical protein